MIFLDIFTTEPFDDECVTEYGIIRSELEKSGQIIGSNNLIIAATVKSKNGTLITHNTGEFSRINGLTLADWTE